jgi:hypothetical protein
MRSVINRAAYVSVLAAILTSCGWRTRYSSASLAGKGEFRVEEKQFFTDSRIRIIYARGGEERIIYNDNRDWLPGLVEFYWPKDSEIAGLVLCNRGAGALVLAVNTSSMKLVDRATVKDKLAEQIRAKYSVPAQRDPLSWACDNEGTFAFRSK